MYRDGQGVKQDDTEAVAWFNKAADQGHAVAQYNLGAMYESRRGIVRDDALAVERYRKAIEQGETYYHTSEDAEAVAWYKRAADQGYAAAQNRLGVMYDEGLSVLKNDYQAVAWYRKAANQGYAYAQYNLCTAYSSGKGGVQDYALAVAWCQKAADQGLAEAKTQLGELNRLIVNKKKERWNTLWGSLAEFLLVTVGFSLILVWAYGAFLFVYTTSKLMNQQSPREIWTFLTCRRLIVMVLVWGVSAPLPLLFTGLLEVGGRVSGMGGGAFRAPFSWSLLCLYLAAAAASLMAIPARTNWHRTIAAGASEEKMPT